MSTMLVSVERVKAALRYDHSDEDAILEFTIQAASRIVLNYLKMDESSFAGSDYDTDGDYPVESDGVLIGMDAFPDVQAATIFMVGVLRRDPDGAEMDKWERGYLPAPVCALLYSLRDPALA